MPGNELDFSVGNEGRPTYGLPTTRNVNVFVEATKAGPKNAARISRPGLTLWNRFSGNGPVLRAYQNPGLFNGDPFFVIQNTLYRKTTSLGTVPYSLQPRMAAANGQLALTTGGGLYVYNGTTLTNIKYFSDGETLLPPFSSVTVLYNIFIYPVAGTNKYYWSDPGDPTSIDLLNFTEAQTSPDPIIEVSVTAEELYFSKSTATEIWDYNPIINSISGTVTQPFQLSQGRTYIRGTPAQGSVVARIDNAMFWVGDDLEVYRSDIVPRKVSTPFIDDRLRAAKDTISQTTAFALGIEGHWFYVLNLPGIGESYAYDCASQQWAQWGTQISNDSLPGLFAGGCAAGQGATIWVGHYNEADVYLLDVSSNLDDEATRPVVTSAAIWVPSGTKRLNNVSLACVRGTGAATETTTLSGGTPIGFLFLLTQATGSTTTSTPINPQVWMRISRDGGRTFRSWMQGHLGFVGEYTYKAVWRNLGVIQQPGCLLEFAVWDNMPVVVEGGAFNVARA